MPIIVTLFSTKIWFLLFSGNKLLRPSHVPTEHVKDLQQRLEEEETASKNVKHLPPAV